MRGSARARDFVTKNSWTIKSVIYNVYQPKPGDLRIKSRKGGNHVDIMEEKTLIGGNVSDAVTRRKWTMSSLVADGTSHITPVNHNRFVRIMRIAANDTRYIDHSTRIGRRQSKSISED